MYRPHVMLVTLAAGLLAVGVLSVMFAGPVAGQSTTPAASAPSVSSASPAASATTEDFTVEPLSTPVGETGCEKEANNPHIATSAGPRRVKGFSQIFSCNQRKDYLWTETTVWKKGNDGDTTWEIADRKTRSCTTCFHTGISAEKPCANTGSNLFFTRGYHRVKNNGYDSGLWASESRTVTLNCGGI